MTGLTAGTTYSVRAYGTNSAGTGYGATVEFTTTAIVAPTVTTDATPSSITTTSAIYDTNSIDSTGNENASTRGICYVTGSGGTPTTSNTVVSTSGSFGVSSYSSSMTGLTAGTTYSVRAFATNSAGTGYGSTVEVTTTAIVAPTVTTDSTPSSITTTGATFDTNNITATGNANATVRGVCYVSGSGGTPTTANSTASASGSFGTGTYSQAITGLSIGTTYSVRAYATNSAGTGYGATVEVTTISNVPPTVALNTPADVVATYYFDGSDVAATDSGTDWTGVTNADDGDIDTDATTSTAGTETTNYLQIEGTNAPASGGSISLVRSRTHNGIGFSGYTTVPAPVGGWTWAILQGLEIRASRDNSNDKTDIFIYEDGNAGGTELVTYDINGIFTSTISKVEIEVTSGATGVSTTPTLEFTGTDAEANDIRYNVQVDTVNTFNSGGLIDKVSNIDPGFANTVTPADTDPFNSGQKADYDVQAGDILTASTTYYWRARGLDPAGSNTYGAWATTRSFTTAAAGGTTGQVKIKSSGTFGAKPVKYKSGGTFSTGAVKYKSGGTFTETN